MVAGLIFLKDKIEVDQAIITSGHGRDYSVVARSSGVDKKLDNELVKFSLPPLILDPSSKFEELIKVFPVKGKRMGISFVSVAGRDEYNRPARLRSHTFLLPQSVYDPVIDVSFLREHVTINDVSGDLDKVLIDRYVLINSVGSLYSLYDSKKFPKFLDIVGDQILVNALSTLFEGKKVVIYAGEKILTSKITDEKRLTSYDFIKFLLLFIPSPWRHKFGYTTFSSRFTIERTSIIFNERTEHISRMDGIFINLENGEIENSKIIGPIKDYVHRLIEHFDSGVLDRTLLYVNSMSESFFNLANIDRENHREGVKLINRILELSEMLMEKFNA